MDTITLSSKGQIVIPKHLRQSAHLSVGDELSITYVSGEIRLRPLTSDNNSQLDQVAGCLARPGRLFQSDEEIKQLIKNRLAQKHLASTDPA